MGRRNKNKFRTVVVLTLIVIVSLALVGAFFMVVRVVQAEFGAPSVNLSRVQQVVFNLELFFNREKLLYPHNIFGEEQYFLIEQGESVGMICLRLEKDGLIPDAELMRIYLVYTGMDRMLKSGQFLLSSSMTPVEIAGELLDSTPSDTVVTILPGWRIEEVAENVATSGLSISADAFIKTATAPPQDLVAILPVDNLSSLEGFLFPGIYNLPRESGLGELFELVLQSFSDSVDETLIDGFERQGLSLNEAVILASIIEREAVVPEEKPLIASVFINRLAIGMRLETDPTVQYALGYDDSWQSWWKAPLFISDLSVESPYNTYQVFGLPPGPISNPSLASLRAVAFPAETPYYFFRAACDNSGRHNFAITFEEHLNNRCE